MGNWKIVNLLDLFVIIGNHFCLRLCQELGGGHRVGKCPTPGSAKICQCPTPAVAGGGGGGGLGWAQLELSDALVSPSF